jgi:hypothetical protein
MAVTSVIERWQERHATTDENGVRTLQRGWAVTTDDDATGEPAVVDGVIAHDATAALYASHPLWVWSVCRNLSAVPNGGPRVWLVTAAYSSAKFSGERRRQRHRRQHDRARPGPEQLDPRPTSGRRRSPSRARK